MITLYINGRTGKRFIKPIKKNILCDIFKETEGLGKIISIHYCQFNTA